MVKWRKVNRLSGVEEQTVHARKHENLVLDGGGGGGDVGRDGQVGDLVYTEPLMDALPLHV